MKYVLYNPLSGNNQGKVKAEEFNLSILGELIDLLTIDISNFIESVAQTDEIYLVGGDGTIFYFINQVEYSPNLPNVFYVPTGTGNDFAQDVFYGKTPEKVVLLNTYMKKLPTVTVNGKEYKFINGVGFGIDGMCCQVGDELRAKKVKKINYTSIAIKQLLFKYKKRNAKVVCDGKTYFYKNVWIAPTMLGRFYGGGMMVAPNQDRLESSTLSQVVFKGFSRLITLLIFPKIFKGEHVKHKKRIAICEGREITVEFSIPCALQVDGETFKNVSKYTVKF